MPFLDLFRPKRRRSQTTHARTHRFPSYSSDDSDIYGNNFPSPYSTALIRHQPSFRSDFTGTQSQRTEVLEEEPWQLLNHSPNYDSDYSRHHRHNGPYSASVSDVPVHIISESSRADSPIPIVHREDSFLHPHDASASRLYEQFTGETTPSTTSTDLTVRDPVDEVHQVHRRNAHRRPVDGHNYADHQGIAEHWQSGSHRAHHLRGPQYLSQKRTFYIVPPGMNVVFQDEQGHELTRVGDFTGNIAPMPFREEPIVLQDEDGHVVYKTGSEMSDDTIEDNAASLDRPNVVHLGRYVDFDSPALRSASPVTVTLDSRGQIRSSDMPGFRPPLQRSTTSFSANPQPMNVERAAYPDGGHPAPRRYASDLGPPRVRMIYP
ncbi:hypothetical protein FA95DRAFT_838082 [Auriscalpium vulgare]|uniref:Uncharacterized protein n=1 Tax=Auriscalpium vulgare TaxID=40419 RepID=A0ACB8S0I4_9AGAM|nr:hypothetical protein FA95DRAFT_838082 [Auriscalpium vulgare]